MAKKKTRRKARTEELQKDPLHRIVGINIRIRRTALGWSQQHLADKLGISRERISEMENGRFSPTFQTLQKYARALGCSVSDLTEPNDLAKKLM